MFQVKRNTLNAFSWYMLGEHVVIKTLKMSHKYLTQTNLSLRVMQACDACYMFVQSSDFDIWMEKFHLPYDTDILRDGLKRIAKKSEKQ